MMLETIQNDLESRPRIAKNPQLFEYYTETSTILIMSQNRALDSLISTLYTRKFSKIELRFRMVCIWWERGEVASRPPSFVHIHETANVRDRWRGCLVLCARLPCAARRPRTRKCFGNCQLSAPIPWRETETFSHLHDDMHRRSAMTFPLLG